MRIDSLRVKLRPRPAMEAVDLGVRMCQHAAPAVWRCYSVVFVPVVGIALLGFHWGFWVPPLVLWLSKPWLDRTILFVLSRATFGHTTSIGALWRARRSVWGSQVLSTWTTRRLSLWRSFTQPVAQLEGLGYAKTWRRVKLLRRNRSGSLALTVQAFVMAEACLSLAVGGAIAWFSIDPKQSLLASVFGVDTNPHFYFLPYALAVWFVEPFFVAAGFALYLNRRAELEAWDVEQDLRRAFAP